MKNNEMFGAAQWVTSGTDCTAPRIRGLFSAKNVKKATLTICGLGFFNAYINGKKVGTDIFAPVTSDYKHVEDAHYHKAFGEVLAHRIYCPQYDVTDLISEGSNCIAVMLAPGWYQLYDDISLLCFRIDMECEDGAAQVLSGSAMKWSPSYITRYELTKGEDHDYTICSQDNAWMLPEFDASGWNDVCITEAPDSEYYVQDCPTDKLIRFRKPVLINETKDVRIYDVCKNITGWPIVCCDSDSGEKVIVRVGEELTPEGLLSDFWNQGQKSGFITDGTQSEMHIQFTWQAFRYIEVSKNAHVSDCAEIYTDIDVNSAFECSDKTLNWFYSTYIHTQLSNMHAGIPSDCPHLERRGYTGDGQLCCEAAMLMTDSQRFYKKWMEDISDCQDRISGHVQYTAPYAHCGGGPGGWGCAIVEVPYVYYKTFGDAEPLKKYFGQMLRYFDYLEAHSENDLVISDQPGLWSLGEWCTPSKEGHKRPDIPEPLVNNYFYAKSIMRMLEIAPLVGRDDVTAHLRELFKIKTDAFVREYYDDSTGDFFGNIQGSNCFAIDLGLGDERTLHNLVKNYCEKGVLDTGIFGTDIVPRILFERGYSELAVSLLASKGEPSFHSWMMQGATTLWEEWFDPRSMNHPMFGAAVRYLFNYILGIRQKAGATGYTEVVIEPCLTDKLTYAKGFITQNGGKISVSASRIDGVTLVEVANESNAKCTFVANGREYPVQKGTNSFTIQ